MSGRIAVIACIVWMAGGCTTTNTAQAMKHPDYTGEVLVTERRMAIEACEKENASMEFVSYQNEVAMDTARGLAQQSHRVSQMAAMNEAVVACMRRNGWRF